MSIFWTQRIWQKWKNYNFRKAKSLSQSWIARVSTMTVCLVSLKSTRSARPWNSKMKKIEGICSWWAVIKSQACHMKCKELVFQTALEIKKTQAYKVVIWRHLSLKVSNRITLVEISGQAPNCHFLISCVTRKETRMPLLDLIISACRTVTL